MASLNEMINLARAQQDFGPYRKPHPQAGLARAAEMIIKGFGGGVEKVRIGKEKALEREERMLDIDIKRQDLEQKTQIYNDYKDSISDVARGNLFAGVGGKKTANTAGGRLVELFDNIRPTEQIESGPRGIKRTIKGENLLTKAQKSAKKGTSGTGRDVNRAKRRNEMAVQLANAEIQGRLQNMGVLKEGEAAELKLSSNAPVAQELFNIYLPAAIALDEGNIEEYKRIITERQQLLSEEAARKQAADEAEALAKESSGISGFLKKIANVGGKTAETVTGNIPNLLTGKSVPKDKVRVIPPGGGKPGFIPTNQLQEALAAGYTEVK